MRNNLRIKVKRYFVRFPLRNALLMGVVLVGLMGLQVQKNDKPDSNNRSQESTSVEFRGANVSIGEIMTREGCDRVLAKAEMVGINAVFVNVFYYGPAYHSREFKWREGVTKDFDPVGYLLPEIKKRGIAFYAMFVNARVKKNLPWYNEEWIIMDAEGKKEGNDERGYRINYCNPEVRAHELAVMLDFARMFPEADGIQFDYIRFPWNKEYPYNPETREMYRKITGIDPLDLEIKKEQWELEEHAKLFENWRDWRKNQITNLVREVSYELWKINPDMQLCASVLAEPHWIKTACQDWPHWANEGLVDFVKPMYYHSDDELYQKKIEWYRSHARNDNYWKRIIPSVSGHVRSDDPILKDGTVRDEAYVSTTGSKQMPEEEEARAQLVVNKVQLMRDAGLGGVNYFTLKSLSDETVQKLKRGVWSKPAKMYIPPRRDILSEK